MEKLWQTTVFNTLTDFYDSEIINPEQVTIVRRAPYFGQYKIAIHFGPNISNWCNFDIVYDKVLNVVSDKVCRLTYIRKALFLSLYTNDVQCLTNLLELSDDIDFNSVRIIREDCWDLKLPKRKLIKGLFYNKYNYRIRVNTSSYNEMKEQLSSVNYFVFIPVPRVNLNQSVFIYCDDVRDVILIKLIFSSLIEEISDYSER